MFQQKKEVKKKEIDASELVEIISHDENDQPTLKKRLVELGFKENRIYELEEHIQHIQAQAKARGFAEHIFVENFKESTFVKEAGCEILYKYKVTISNLKIQFKYKVHSPRIFMHHLSTQDSSSDDYKPSGRRFSATLYFEFKHNYIYGSDNPINVFLGHGATLSFIENYFKGVNIVTEVQNTAVAVLEFKKNISESPISIGKYSDKEIFSSINSWRLKKDIKEQIYVVDRLEKIINKYALEEKKGRLERSGNSLKECDLSEIATKEEKNSCAIRETARVRATAYEYNKIKITPEQVKGTNDQCIIRISDNKFDVLNIFGMTNFYFEGRNVIKQLTPSAPDYPDMTPGETPIESTVHWGAHQKLDKDGAHFLTHKKIFTVLKQQAIDDNDTAQEMILQREIAKCDHAIAKSERWRAWQDRTIFGFSKWISNYGTSWARPLGWLVVLNLLSAVLAQCITGHNFKMLAFFDAFLKVWKDFDFYTIFIVLGNSSTLAIFFELFNPTSYLPRLLDPTTSTLDSNAWISFLFIFQKVILAFTLYEMVKIFRRFGKR